MTARALLLLLCLATCVPPGQAQEATEPEQAVEEPAFPGLDESVNEALAEEAGVPSRDPLINVEAMGELWTLLLLAAGGVCGFILGRYWDQLWGRREDEDEPA